MHFTKINWGTDDAHVRPANKDYDHYWLDAQQLSYVDKEGYTILHDVAGKRFATPSALEELCEICKELNTSKIKEFDTALQDALAYLKTVDTNFGGKIALVRDKYGPVLPEIVKRWVKHYKHIVTQAEGSVNLTDVSHVYVTPGAKCTQIHFLDTLMNERGSIMLSEKGAELLGNELLKK